MAKTLSTTNIGTGFVIQPEHVLQIIKALTQADDYDIGISGSLSTIGPTLLGGDLTVGNTSSFQGITELGGNSNGYDILRLKDTYTPTDENDPNGLDGNFSYDSGSIYFKAGNKWRELKSNLKDKEEARWTIDLTAQLTASLYAPNDLRINNMDIILGTALITIEVNNLPYTMGNLINQADEITISSNAIVVCNLDLTYE